MRSRFSLSLLWALSLSVISSHTMAQSQPSVELERVSTSDIMSEVRLNGTVNALRRSQLSSSVAGLIETVAVDTGDRVSEGDLLIALDDEMAEFERDEARAALNEAEVRLAEAQRRLDEARSVGVGRNIAATEVSSRESDLAAARASVAQLEARRNRLQVELDRHRVRAPFTGVVSQRAVDLGEWVVPGNELMTLVDTTNLRLDFAVPQNYFDRVSDRSRLLLRPGSPGQKPLAAEIVLLVPVTDAQARTFLLRAKGPESLTLLPGMSVEGTLHVSTGEQGLTVSRDAINRYPEGRTTVWIAEPADEDRYQVREKRVSLGGSFNNRVEVLSGLEGGERVVIRGNESLREGTQVRLAERSAR
ncbi:efflux RND transporter periplasmic adaptor subunit [Marinobacter sp. CHS3-4]|uniref:efflux RND transporter periplasmic adaptor subunit n=1 Tax=Marinobacter sp. CHS3-4 TaxID=3045174 RepID=UPI0024B5512C|nr:efflux RND transporter periplasmic adaptor subunit [Marinobacter sp. CHS3-4]MDI9243649.1 efflux RND transporter periplasmic adaptor subunit [Marinobacter sp. CHS3-4]